MLKRVLIIGGYGNFGAFISETLSKEANIQVIVAGRSLLKAQQCIQEFSALHPPEAVAIDINHDCSESLTVIAPDIVIHTSGPFQGQGYDLAKYCIENGINYIDLADGREFVAGISQLNASAKQAGVTVISGASSVPCLTSALVDYYQEEFGVVSELDYGITTAQKTARGLATTAAILGYTGKKITTLIKGESSYVYGWQGLRLRKYKSLGRRFLGYCDVPDLALFPERYPKLKTVRFYAGLEIPFIHLTLWLLSGLVRVGLIKHLEKWAPLLLKTSFLFDFLGSSNSAFHMTLLGLDKQGNDKKLSFELLAKSGDGPYIPCMPAIILTKKLAANELNQAGAFPCVGVITRDEYLQALEHFDISWQTY